MFGYNTGTIRNLQVADFNLSITNAVTSNTIYAGGLVGYNAGKIQKCSAENGNVYVSVGNVRQGALITGENAGTIENCWATGNVKLEQPSDSTNVVLAAGIAGLNRSVIKNCLINAYIYSYGYGKQYAYTGDYNHYGEAGFITDALHSPGTIDNCLVFGRLEAKRYGGDISGFSTGTITNCYKDENLSISNPTHTYATAMSKTQLSNATFYRVTLKWDSTVWDYSNINLEDGIYPSLIYNF